MNWTVIVRWIEPNLSELSHPRLSQFAQIGIFMTMWVFVGFNIFFHYYLLGRGFNVG